MSESISYSHEKDGTLVVTVPKGTNVGRVLVQEEGTCIGSLYYPDHFAESSKMMDTISRQAAIEIVRVRCARIPTMAIRAMQELKDLPTEEPERKRGRWELDDDPHDGDCRCSYCGTAIEAMHERHHGLLNTLTGGKWWTFYPYCPHCGAQMEKGREQT